jgi:GNAT superfamily N-acetyltransferase
VPSEVREMVSEEETAATFPVMRQLRPYLEEGVYAERIERMRGDGYRLAAVLDDGRVTCVAGFRIQDFLYTGRHLYVDDLVTDEAARSGGHGKRMMDWLVAKAKRSGCEQLHLDSGVGRADAHRFYFREGMRISSYHFAKEL